MKDTIIAIPSEAPGGLDALRSCHFGRCDAFTLVALRNSEVVGSRVIPNGDHEEGGCLAPVELLFREGATAVVVGGIGPRPLQGFHGRGIEVLARTGERVRDVVHAYIAGGLRPIAGSDVCSHHHG